MIDIVQSCEVANVRYLDEVIDTGTSKRCGTGERKNLETVVGNIHALDEEQGKVGRSLQ